MMIIYALLEGTLLGASAALVRLLQPDSAYRHVNASAAEHPCGPDRLVTLSQIIGVLWRS